MFSSRMVYVLKLPHLGPRVRCVPGHAERLFRAISSQGELQQKLLTFCGGRNHFNDSQSEISFRQSEHPF
jgi:hypothetical protein